MTRPSLVLLLAVTMGGCATVSVEPQKLPSSPVVCATGDGQVFDCRDNETTNALLDLIPGEDPSMWVLVYYVGHSYWNDPKQYPAIDYRAFNTLEDCEAARYAFEKGTQIELEWIKPDEPRRFECVYEPDWLNKPWHAQPEVHVGVVSRIKDWWINVLYKWELYP